jgi:uncharacterized membrane protein YhaH (DUF805 family)
MQQEKPSGHLNNPNETGTKRLRDFYPFRDGDFFSLEGRISRAKYLWTILAISVIALAVVTVYPPLYTIMFLFVAIASANPIVKRLHDINKSGGYYWFTYIPLANFIIGMMLLFKKGTDGKNQYGDDPLSKE